MIRLRLDVIAPLNDLVQWDRYGIRDNDSGFIYGWIPRDDSFYDFVIITFALEGANLVLNYNTSSSKISKEIGLRLGLTDKEMKERYVPCLSASDIPEANLVRWQKEDAKREERGMPAGLEKKG
jgi:hypothetical protein